MTWLFILGYLGKIKDALLKYPWQVGLILSLAWGYYEHRQANKWHTLYNSYIEAEKKAVLQSKVKANEADANHSKIVSDGDTLVRNYVSAHRLPKPTTNQAKSGNPAILTDTSTEAILAQLKKPVAIEEDDVKICDMNYAYAQAAYEWARTINQ